MSRHRHNAIILGRGSYIAGRPTVLWESYGSKIRVGNYSSIARGSTFLLGGHHPTSRVTTHPFGKRDKGYTKGDIWIGSDVWICHGVSILDGVTIGDGAVVGAFSVVAKDVPQYAIVAGNPARVVRYRFDEPTIKALLKIQWWNWPPDAVREAVKMLRSEDVATFIKQYGGKDEAKETR